MKRNLPFVVFGLNNVDIWNVMPIEVSLTKHLDGKNNS